MQLERARIKNFRSLRDIEVSFGAHTALIGGNGAGKSSILKAIEKFYSTSKNCQDLQQGRSLASAQGRSMIVRRKSRRHAGRFAIVRRLGLL